MSAFFEYRGHKGQINFSKEDGCFFGQISDIPDLILYEGDSLEQLEESFQEAVDDYIDNAAIENRKAHKPFSGTLNVRLGKDLHADLAKIAENKGKTINAIIKEFCSKEAQIYKNGTRFYKFPSMSVHEGLTMPSDPPLNTLRVRHEHQYIVAKPRP